MELEIRIVLVEELIVLLRFNLTGPTIDYKLNLIIFQS